MVWVGLGLWIGRVELACISVRVSVRLRQTPMKAICPIHLLLVKVYV